MTFSQYAGIAIVPTLARLVLAAVFISVGWNKVFKYSDFNAEQATQLRALGVNVELKQATAGATTMNPQQESPPADGVQFTLTSFRQEASPPPAATPPIDQTGTEEPEKQEDQEPPVSTPPAAPDAPVEPLPEGIYTAQSLHSLTLLLHKNDIPQPVWMARLAAFTELIGGAMLLLGLFSRIWGLGLAIAMGMAFYLVSMKINGVFEVDPRVFAENIQQFNTAGIQLSLFVLAFGILLTGPGPLSLDRLLFGGSDGAAPGDAKID